jgi:SAM-dependent methyltransferase
VDLSDLQTTWDGLGAADPLWAILTDARKKGRRWDTEEFFATGARAIDALMSDLRSLGHTVGGRAALDFGCGVGRLTQPLTKYFDEVVGVDLSQEMVRLAQAHNRAPDRCRYVVNASTELAMLPTGSFDLVLSYLTLQHMPPRYSTSYLREFVRVARIGGIICVQLPAAPATFSEALRVPIRNARNSLRALLARFGIGRGAEMAMYGVSRETVRDLLREAGARLEEVVPADHFTPGWTGYRYIAIKESSPP